MIRSILNWFAGYTHVSVRAEEAVTALNLLCRERFIYWNLVTHGDGSLSFVLLHRHIRAYLSHSGSAGISPQCSETCGFPRYWEKYRERWGIAAGALLFAGIVWWSGSVVWAVEITGNERVSDAEIRTLLSEHGFKEGTHFGDMDFDVFQNDVLLSTDQLSWIAVNMLGTVAHVEVRETQSVPREPGGSGAANLVAREDGQIVEVAVAAGRAVVSQHDIVRRGDLLISGVLTLSGDTLRFEYASGRVLAQVYRRIEVEAPLVEQVKVYTGEESCRKSIIFFGKEIKFFQNSGIESPNYDTIIKNISLALPGGTTLPIRLYTEIDRAYVYESVDIGETRAKERAESRFREALCALAEEAEILSFEYTAALADGVCRITADVVCVTDIAQTREIPIS